MKTFKAKFNEAGNCIYCGESGRCPKRHNSIDTPRIFDSGSKLNDRYTVIIDQSIFAMCTTPLSPLGINQYCGEVDELGYTFPIKKEVGLSTLPIDVQTAIKYRKDKSK